MRNTEESELTVYTLTDQGWPRPVVGGYPIPWVAPAERLSEVNEGRRLASVSGAICQVCGLDFPYAADAYGFTWGDDLPGDLTYGDYLSDVPGTTSATPVTLLDGAILHLHCAKLTAARCPHVRDGEHLVCIRFPANEADPVVDVSGKIVPTYPAGDVMYVPWPIEGVRR